MQLWNRLAVAFFYTIGLGVGGILYGSVFVGELQPLVSDGGRFSYLVSWLDVIVPLVLVGILVVVWYWVITGAVQEEQTVQRRRL